MVGAVHHAKQSAYRPGTSRPWQRCEPRERRLSTPDERFVAADLVWEIAQRACRFARFITHCLSEFYTQAVLGRIRMRLPADFWDDGSRESA